MEAAEHITLDAGRIRVAGKLRMEDAPRVWTSLVASARNATSGRLDIDVSDASIIDGAVMALLVELRAELVARGVASEIVGASDKLRPIVHLYGGDERLHEAAPIRATGLVERVGDAVLRQSQSLTRLVQFVGDLTASSSSALRRPATVDWRSMPSLAERAGIDGVAIVMLLNFLVGFVMAFQSSRQLKLYGANVFVADVVGISVTRELAPLMTAIIMSGRSGAAFAAELGTMRVSEEIDALRTMGFAPITFLIFPRVIALALVAPVLTLLGDVVGVLGGVVVAVSSLDVSARGYLAELRTAVLASDVWTGLVKSLAFAVAIALIGCQQGFATRGAAAGVGRGTTATVVLCLFTVVIIDTLFTVLFRTFGR